MGIGCWDGFFGGKSRDDYDYAERIYYDVACPCGNAGLIIGVHVFGGENDLYRVTLRCKKCGETLEMVVEEPEELRGDFEELSKEYA